jgi:hypothetical protein
MFDAGADVLVQLTSEHTDDGVMGVSLKITKENDIGRQPPWLHALVFNESGLLAIRPQSRGEFPDLEADRPMSILQRLVDYTLDQPQGRANTTDAAKALKVDAGNVSKLFRHSDSFKELGREGHTVWYGVLSRER